MNVPVKEVHTLYVQTVTRLPVRIYDYYFLTDLSFIFLMLAVLYCWFKSVDIDKLPKIRRFVSFQFIERKVTTNNLLRILAVVFL